MISADHQPKISIPSKKLLLIIIVVSEKHDGQMRPFTMLPFFRCNKVSFSRRTWSFRVNTHRHAPTRSVQSVCGQFQQLLSGHTSPRPGSGASSGSAHHDCSLVDVGSFCRTKSSSESGGDQFYGVVGGNYLLDFFFGGLEMFRLWSLVCLMKWKFCRPTWKHLSE